MSSLSGLLEIQAAMKMNSLAKPAPGWITNEFRTACVRSMNEPRGGTNPQFTVPVSYGK